MGIEHLGLASLRLEFHFYASLHIDTSFSTLTNFLPFEWQ